MTPRTSAFLLAAGMASCTASAGTMTDLGTLNGGGGIGVAYAINANGNIVVGDSSAPGGGQHAFKYTGSTMADLGTLLGGNFNSWAYGVSDDGGVIVGQSFTSVGGFGRFHAFKYTGTTMTDLGTLPGGSYSMATGVSGDGNIIVGYSNISTGGNLYRAFKYTGSTMTNLGTLAGGDTSRANAASADGSVIVGGSNMLVGGSLQNRAFKYTGSTMTNLGTLAGGDSSNATGVSSDGSVVVGFSTVLIGGSLNTHAFKYVGTTMTDLGTLPGGDDSMAYGVSADGSVIVGYSNALIGGTMAPRAFLYTNGTMLDVPTWMASINGSRSVYASADQLFKLTLEGAHHRPLLSYDGMGKESQAWVTGDFGSSSRKTDSSMAAGEAGFSKIIAPGLLGGIAFGTAQQNGNLDLGGSSHLAGNYMLGEVDCLMPDKQSIISLIAALGRYDADFNRGYDTGSGAQYSAGNTSVQMRSLRLRLDGPAYGVGLGVTVSPYVSYALSRSAADAYTETGGSFPASYNAISHTTKEGRLGLTASRQVDPSTKVLLSAEVIHRFDGDAPALTGTDLTNSLAFSAPGVAPTRDQVRVGLDVDHKLSADTLLNLSLHAAGTGPSPDFQAALSLRRAF